VRFKEGVSAILGADLETSKTNPLTGWDAVVNSGVKPQTRAKFVKVPHHGSKTGHHPKFWSDLAEENPVGILTEFSSHSLPLERDIDRLKSLTSELYCTTVPKVKIPKRDKTIEKTMNNVVRTRRVLSASSLGRVTLRIGERGTYEVDLSPHSFKL
jgi:beta-lactamase superfamily II metal-dependent hydrolase